MKMNLLVAYTLLMVFALSCGSDHSSSKKKESKDEADKKKEALKLAAGVDQRVLGKWDLSHVLVNIPPTLIQKLYVLIKADSVTSITEKALRETPDTKCIAEAKSLAKIGVNSIQIFETTASKNSVQVSGKELTCDSDIQPLKATFALVNDDDHLQLTLENQKTFVLPRVK